MHALLSFFRRRRGGLTATGLLLAAFVLLVITRAGTGNLEGVREAIVDAVGTAQELILSPVVSFRRFQDRMDSFMRLEEENLALKAELEKLRPELARLKEETFENRRLRALLNFQPDPSFRHLAARVVGSSSSSFSRSLIINAGKNEGVYRDAPALGAGGLAGRVIQSGRRMATVLSLLDINSRAPVVVQRTRIQAIAAGDNSRLLHLEFVPKEADVNLGDHVVSSGTGGLFPKGLPVGKVLSVEPFGPGLFKKVVVKPAVNFDRLEEVRLLLTEPADDGP